MRGTRAAIESYLLVQWRQNCCHTGSELGHVGALELLVQPGRWCAGQLRPSPECLPQFDHTNAVAILAQNELGQAAAILLDV